MFILRCLLLFSFFSFTALAQAEVSKNNTQKIEIKLNPEVIDKNAQKQEIKINEKPKLTSDKVNAMIEKSAKYHIVKNGDNIYRIALKYKISQKELLDENNLKNTNIFVGQKLQLPKNAYFETENVDTEKPKSTINENLNKVETVKQQNVNLINKIETTTFIWPSRGTILTHFGYSTNTGKLEGVNIGGETGSVVRASSSGDVVYNDKISGYDNVILIRHYNGFYTAYGFTDPLVVVGDKVKKGQVIAYMTKNKQSKRSMLYFSIRKNGKSYDPEKIIQTKISN